MGVDSKKMEYGPGTVYAWCSFFSRLRGWGTVIVQLSGFYCRPYLGVLRESHEF